MIPKARWYHTGLLCGLLLALLVRSPQAGIQCDGVDDLLTSGLPLEVFIDPAAFTITAWVLSTGSAFGGVNCWGNGPFLVDDGGYVAVGRTDADGRACAYLWDGTHRNITGSALAAGWHHLAARLSGGVFELVVDGLSVTSLGTGNVTDLPAGLLNLCGGTDGHSPDRITEVTVWPTGLSTAFLAGMAQSRLRQYPGPRPAAYWPLTDCPDGTSGHTVSFKDRSGNAGHLTGAHGANLAGLTCRADGHLSHAWGIQ